MLNVTTENTRRLSMRSLRSGALIEESYVIFQHWDVRADIKTNLDRLKTENFIGARSTAWVTEVAKTLGARFQKQAQVIPLAILAQAGTSIDQWRECLLWHVGQQDALFHDFLSEWLYASYRAGTFRIRTEDVVPFVIERTSGRISGTRNLEEVNQIRTARDLLRMGTEFGLLKGRAVREFSYYHLSDVGFQYVLYALMEQEPNPRRIIDSPEWRIFLMGPEEVEAELLRQHQFQRLHYEAAGSLANLQLPYSSLLAYVESLVS